MDALTLATIVGNLAIAFSFVVALVFGVAQARAAARDRKERLTIETIRGLQTREFAEHFYRSARHPPPATASDFEALSESERIEHIHFSYQMELIGLLVHEGTIDIDLVEKTLGDFVTNAWTRYGPLLTDMRRANEDPYLAEYFQWLAQRMQAFMGASQRRPAFEGPLA